MHRFANTLIGTQRWLRPGRLYLLGRTSNSANELAVSHKTVSRKHVAISVAAVDEGAAQNLTSRSAVIIEDLKSSKGTTLNGAALHGSKEVSGDNAEFKLGFNPEIFRLYWVPVILVYSSAAKSSQVDMLTNLRNQLEQLDIKFLADYHVQATHIVTRKRNTPKGLQALINAKYMVTNSYVDTIVAAAGSTPDTQGISLLEQDYSKHWPKPEDFVPPKGNEAIDRPPESFLPDAERQDVFKGYTFVFYDEAQHRNLMAPISSGKGKALLYNVDPQSTRADNLVQYVKTIAGETGIGEFDDGSVGPGVVVVRYVPTSGEDVEWYTRFITDVSLCLNHRAIEQSQFIEAILTKDATFLRRPLPTHSSATTNISTDPAALSTPILPPQYSTTLVLQPASAELSSQGTSGLGARGSTTRGRKPATRRFKGFDSDDDDVSVSFASQWQSGLQSGASTVPPEPDIHIPKGENQDSDDGLFVPEGPAVGVTQTISEVRSAPRRSTRPERKRPLQALVDDSLMDEIAPTAALAKRQRLENGEDPAIVENYARPESEPDQHSPISMPKQRKIKKELDVLEAARKVREQEEARLQRERDDMAQLPGDIDLLAIRQLHVVEEIPLRQRLPVPTVGSDDADSLVASGRWDPRWNGRRNFKRFRVRGDPVGRVPMRTIVSLTQVKTKDFGIGDDYWLEEHGSHRAEGHGNEEDGAKSDRHVERPGLTAAALQRATHYTIASESESDDDFLSVEDVQPIRRGQRGTAAAASSRAQSTTQLHGHGTLALASLSSTQSQPQGQPQGRTAQKRTRAQLSEAVAVEESTAKRTRATRKTITIPDSDSEEEGRFRFGRRR
ncbi:hypothetical protein Cpir12675_000901 [Ceratocystis pirilliformis]|uniref:FHA domain-containing protein n=1 Tax=Ceratocystis pirilliformis TaxID=259994 RepID=A0ABR3ZK65_9PEZI